jgi:hypothetical protein
MQHTLLTSNPTMKQIVFSAEKPNKPKAPVCPKPEAPGAECKFPALVLFPSNLQGHALAVANATGIVMS